MNTNPIEEFYTKVQVNRIINNRPIEPQTKKSILVYTDKELKHFQKCKKSICDECRTILSKLEVNGSK